MNPALISLQAKAASPSGCDCGDSITLSALLSARKVCPWKYLWAIKAHFQLVLVCKQTLLQPVRMAALERPVC